jgi:hypothetical protein
MLRAIPAAWQQSKMDVTFVVRLVNLPNREESSRLVTPRKSYDVVSSMSQGTMNW